MKKIRKWIYILVPIIVIIILLIIILKMYLNKNSSDNNSTTDFETTVQYKANEEVREETNKNRYYATKNIVNKFLSNIVLEDSKSLVAMMEPNYKKEKNINENNILEKLKIAKLNELTEYESDNLQMEIEIGKMYVKEKSANISTYLVTGNLKSNILDINDKYSLIILEDSSNETFYILPNDYVIENNYNDIEQFKNYSNNYDSIEKNEYNIFEYSNIEDNVIVNDYLSRYKNILVKDIKEAYDLLDEDYRNKRFDDYSQYEKYVTDNKRQLLSVTFTKYKTLDKDGKKEYVCIDKNNNYYIFKETAIMDFKMYLDDYTIDLDEFVEKYNKADDNTKVCMNVDKVVKAINRNDYNYIYKKLDDQFKKNNFGTLEEFENYMKQNLNGIFDATYYNATKKNEVYEQPVTLKPKDSSDNDDNTKKLTIIMKLKEGTDFVMSFSIN